MNVGAVGDVKGPSWVLAVGASGCLLLLWLKKCIKTTNSIWNGKNLTQHLCARQIHRDYPHAHNCPSHTRFKHLLLFFFAVVNNSLQCSFISRPHPALILRYRSTHGRERHWLTRCLVHPLLLPEQWVAPLAGVSIKKHKGATGGLHGHARPIIYIDSPGAFEKCRVGHIQYPVQRFHHESLLFDFHLLIVAAVRGNQRRPSSLAIIAYHSIAI